MKCEKAIALLSEYIDDRLDSFIRLEIERHLNNCESCRNELTILTKTIKILRAASVVNKQ